MEISTIYCLVECRKYNERDDFLKSCNFVKLELLTQNAWARLVHRTLLNSCLAFQSDGLILLTMKKKKDILPRTLSPQLVFSMRCQNML